MVHTSLSDSIIKSAHEPDQKMLLANPPPRFSGTSNYVWLRVPPTCRRGPVEVRQQHLDKRRLHQLYNDGYCPILGAKHPRAMGQPTRACWPEVWGYNAPIYDAVMARGEVVYAEDQLFCIARNGYVEEAYFTLCYSPIRDESGGPGDGPGNDAACIG